MTDAERNDVLFAAGKLALAAEWLLRAHVRDAGAALLGLETALNDYNNIVFGHLEQQNEECGAHEMQDARGLREETAAAT